MSSFGKTGLEVSHVGLGCWQLGGAWGSVPSDEALGIVRAARELGADVFDTALEYGDGQSERALSRALGRELDDVVVISKVPPRNEVWYPRGADSWRDVFPDGWVRSCLRRTLEHLRRDLVDVLLLHTWCADWGPEALQALDTLRTAGEVRFIGISTSDFDWRIRRDAREAIDVWEVNASATHQAPFGDIPADGPAVMARCPFSSGSLASDWRLRGDVGPDDWRASGTDADWWEAQRRNSRHFGDACTRWGVSRVAGALAVPLRRDGVSIVIPGARSVEQARSSLTAPWRDVPAGFLSEVQALWREGKLIGVDNGA